MTDWTFLREWFEALVPWLEYREWPDIEKRTLRSRLRALRVYLTKPEEIQETASETVARLTKLREAIELIGLALHYDRNAWEQFELLDPKPAEYKHWSHFGDPSDLEPRFELAFDVSHEAMVFQSIFYRVVEEDVFAWDMHLCELLLQHEPSKLSAAYHTARDRIVAIVGQAFNPLYRLELQFVFMPPRQPTTSYVVKVQKFIQAIHAPASPCRQVFLLKLVHAYLHELPYTAEMAGFFEFIRASDIQLAMASIGARRNATDNVVLERVVEATMKVEARAPASSREPRMMVVHKCDAQLFKQICVQLASGTDIDHLVFEDAFRDVYALERGEEKTKWKLLGQALGVVSEVRPLKVLSLAAMMKITAEDVKCMYKDLQAPREVPVQKVTLPNDAVVRLPSGLVVSLNSLKHTSRSFPVVDDETDSEWMHVDIPRVGTCNIRCEDIVDAEMSLESITPKGKLETLDIGCVDCKEDAVFMLTQCFMSSLRHLNMHVGFETEIDSVTCAQILALCRRLEFISLTNVTVRNLTGFRLGYGNPLEVPTALLRSLSLTNAQTDDASLMDFIKILTDPAHKMSQTLREFRYVDSKLRNLRASSNRPSPSTIKVILRMLEVNKTLAFLEVGLVPALYKTYEPKFRVFHNQMLPAIAMDDKLAFLSVLLRPRASNQQSVKRSRSVAQLPSVSRRRAKHIAKGVWQFVAAPVLREVSVVEIKELEEL